MWNWIKFSGASPKLLEKTGDFYEKESIKYTRYGMLVFVPAILGAISGGYAISTITDNQIVMVVFGIVWFFVILFIDMAISATMYKTKKSKTWEFWITVVFRLIFAICVGMVVSHPLVLRVFEESINKNITDRHRLNKEADIDKADKDLIQAQSSYQIQITNLKNQNQCLETLIQFERSAKNTKDNVQEFFDVNNVSCGFNSGLGAGCTAECKQRKNLIKENEKKIQEIEKQMHLATQTQQNVLSDAKLRKDIAPPTDYLERTEALDVLMNGDGENFKAHPHVSTAAKTLILFFVFLDILIVLLKALTPMGAYEHTMDLYLDRHIDTMKAKNLLEVKIINDSQEVLNKVALKQLDMEESSKLFEEALSIFSKNAIALENYKKDRLSQIPIYHLKKRKALEEEFIELDKLYQDVKIATMNKLNKILSELLLEKTDKGDE